MDMRACYRQGRGPERHEPPKVEGVIAKYVLLHKIVRHPTRKHASDAHKELNPGAAVNLYVEHGQLAAVWLAIVARGGLVALDRTKLYSRRLMRGHV